VDRRALRIAIGVPTQTPVLDPAAAVRVAADHGFVPRPETDERLVGIEIEWLTVRRDDPARPAALTDVRAAAEAAALSHGSRISFEPGGQIELSSAAAPAPHAVTALAADAAVLTNSLHSSGIDLLAIGLEPGARRERAVRTPRYDAMERFFDARGVAGRTMMRSTAALQVNLDLGPADETDERWRLMHALGPVLAAAFANSPFSDGRPTGWRSTRLAVWNAIDPTRTRPVANGVDCRRAWGKYALEADVMLLRRNEHDHLPVPPGMSFAQWIEHGHPEGWPTLEDLEYHLTTLFPPVRPRGWFELRMVDAVPSPWWRVAAAVAAALVNDVDAAACARLATRGTEHLWLDAARHGLEHPELAAAARTCFAAALHSLARQGGDPDTLDATAQFFDRYVRRARCPADDLLDAWRHDGTLIPQAETA
jgi:glutamate--cysteine ligase